MLLWLNKNSYKHSYYNNNNNDNNNNNNNANNASYNINKSYWINFIIARDL